MTMDLTVRSGAGDEVEQESCLLTASIATDILVKLEGSITPAEAGLD